MRAHHDALRAVCLEGSHVLDAERASERVGPESLRLHHRFLGAPEAQRPRVVLPRMARLARLLGQRAQCGYAGGIERLGIDAGRGCTGDGDGASGQAPRVRNGDERCARVPRDVRCAVFVVRQRSASPCRRAVLRLPRGGRRAERSAARLAAKRAQLNTLGVGRMGEREPDDGGFETTHGADCARISGITQRDSGFDGQMTRLPRAWPANRLTSPDAKCLRPRSTPPPGDAPRSRWWTARGRSGSSR